jgi:hypothetical protein
MGSELEKTITELVKQDGRLIDDIDLFLQKGLTDNLTYIVPKKVFKKSEKFSMGGEEPDFIVLRPDVKNNHCYIIELKDGHVFDTKKSQSEKINLEKLRNYIAPYMTYEVSVYICCFNQPDKEQIRIGLKNKFTLDEIMTGKEFCELLKIDYNAILTQRGKDAKENFAYFVNEVKFIAKI